jgi:uncharacterized protein (DUF433 family)
VELERVHCCPAICYAGEEASLERPVMAEVESLIVLDPAILDGKPVIRGTRLSVEHVIGLMAEGWRADEIIAEYPGLTSADIAACLAYARDVLRAERVYPHAA